mgnify:CR=1 FL=1
MKKYIVIGLLVVSFVVTPVFVSAQTSQQTQIIRLLQSLIQLLTQQLSMLQLQRQNSLSPQQRTDILWQLNNSTDYVQLISRTQRQAVFKFSGPVVTPDVNPMNVLYCIKGVSVTAPSNQPCNTQTSPANNFSINYNPATLTLTINDISAENFGAFDIGCAACTTNIKFTGIHSSGNVLLPDKIITVY